MEVLVVTTILSHGLSPIFTQKKTGWEGNTDSWLAVPEADLIGKPLVDYQLAQQAGTTLEYFAEGGAHEGTPFFIAVGFHKPHLPFVFPESYLYPMADIQLPNNSYAPTDMPKVAWSSYGELRNYDDIQLLGATGRLGTTLPDQTVKDLRRAYYSAIKWTDKLVGDVLLKLKELGFENDTIVSLIGDHGWQLGEHGEWCKQTNFELATHAPMMIHIPGMTDAGIVSEKLTELVDLFPTLVEAAELDPMPLCQPASNDIALCTEGESLIPLINDVAAPWKTAAFSQFPRKLNNGKEVMGYTVKTDKYRYTEWPVFSYTNYTPNWSQLSGEELYDHQVDLDENTNVAGDAAYATIKSKLSDILRAGWRDVIPVTRSVTSGTESSTTGSLTANLIRLLKRLIYQ